MRRLTLTKETVAELSVDDLVAVVGANNTYKLCISGIVACVTHRCVTDENCLTVAGC